MRRKWLGVTSALASLLATSAVAAPSCSPDVEQLCRDQTVRCIAQGCVPVVSNDATAITQDVNCRQICWDKTFRTCKQTHSCE